MECSHGPTALSALPAALYATVTGARSMQGKELANGKRGGCLPSRRSVQRDRQMPIQMLRSRTQC